MQYKLLITPMFFLSFTLFSQGQIYQINNAAIIASEKLGEVSVLFNEDYDQFYVKHNDDIKEVQPCFVDDVLKAVKKNNVIDKYLEKGCKIDIKQMDDGEFKLVSTVPGLGGGPILAGIAYFGFKALAWTGIGLAVAGTTGAIVATGGAAAPVAGTVLAGASAGLGATTAAGVGVGIAAASTGAAAGIGIAATGCAGAAAAGAATAVTAAATTGAAAVAGATGGVGILALIEAGAMWASAACLALPTP